MQSASEPTSVVVGKTLRLVDVHRVATSGLGARLDDEARRALESTRTALLDDLNGGATIYGVNTGFGALSDRSVPDEHLQALQKNLLRSHACGVGPLLPLDVVRGLLLLRAHTLALGASGVSAGLVDGLLELLHRGVAPCVPSQGSVGASGDLAPLAHLALPLIGEGQAEVAGETLEGAEALKRVGLAPLPLGPKEGISLINGTQVTAAIGVLAAWEAAEVLVAADIVGALSVDAQLGSAKAFDPRIHAGKPHDGQRASASVVRDLLQDSPLNRSHGKCGQVQDAYSLRCLPQVHGTVRNALRYVSSALEIEINSFTDNPLIVPRDEGGYDVLAGGNFHACAVAVPLDHLAAAMTTVGTISERRTDRFMTPQGSRGLPPFLADDPGLESGFMMVQVTASALASECKSLSFPASVDTIPTSAGKEDHVSMGPIAARKARQVVNNVATILAIEAACAARALDLREHATSVRLRAAYDVIRSYVPPHQGDRSMSAELERLTSAILRGELRAAVSIDPLLG